MKPAISVVLPVYNGEEFLKEAVESILGQSFSDFELIIVDDGSTDGTLFIVNNFCDNRITCHRNSANIGISQSLNKAIAMARGQYIARMDADDISLPDRLIRQKTFLDNNPEIGVCGSWIKTLGTSPQVWKMPGTHEDIATMLFFRSCILHPTVMLRKSALDGLSGPYNEEFDGAEDYSLWTELTNCTEFANMQEVLLLYRNYDAESASKQGYKERQANLARRIRESYLRQCSIKLSSEELLALHAIAEIRYGEGPEFLMSSADCLTNLWGQYTAHNPSRTISEDILAAEMLRVCSTLSHKINTYPAFSDFVQQFQHSYLSKRLSLIAKLCRNRLFNTNKNYA